MRHRQHASTRKQKVQTKWRGIVAPGGDQSCKRRSKSPSGTISIDGVAELPADGEGDLVGLSPRLAAASLTDRGDIAHPESPAAGPLAVTAQGSKFGATGDRSDHALSLWRPFRRRERRTARPPRVDLRARKPCFIARLRLFGWNVRFMKISSGHKHRPTKASVASSYSATRLLGDTDLSGP